MTHAATSRSVRPHRVATGLILRAALVALVAVLAAAAASASQADAKTKWLCRPGHSPDPWRRSLKTTVTSSGGKTRIVNPKPARHPKIDCFYVYPTVSTQPRPNANLHRGKGDRPRRQHLRRLRRTGRQLPDRLRVGSGLRDLRGLRRGSRRRRRVPGVEASAPGSTTAVGQRLTRSSASTPAHLAPPFAVPWIL